VSELILMVCCVKGNEAMSYAGFWKRLAAWVIDSLILILPDITLSFVLFNMVNANKIDRIDPETFKGAYYISSIIIGWIYFTTMEASRYQGTLGKLLIRIKVTDLNGNKITFLDANGRLFGKIISGFIFGIGFIMIAFTPKKQGLHDRMMDCLVLNR